MRGLFGLEKVRRIRRFVPVLVVGIVGVAASISIWYMTLASESRAVVHEFDGRANNQAIILQKGIEDYWDKLYAIRALFDSSNNAITREEFEIFSNSLLVSRAAILNIAWLPRVKREERVAHEAAAVRDGLLDYRIRAFGPDSKLSISPERDEYLPKFYSTESRTSPVYGLDLIDGGIREGVINRIRDGNVLSTSPPLTLLIGQGNRRGFWAGVPVYARGLPHETVEDRRRNLLGIVQGVFQIEVLIGTILSDVKTPVNLYVFAPNAAADALPIYFTSRLGTGSIETRSQAQLEAGLHRSFGLNFGDIPWKMVVVPVRAGLMSGGHERSSIVLIFGLLLSGGMASFVWVMRRHSRKLETTNDKLEIANDKFEKTNIKLDAALNNMVQGLLMFDRTGKLAISNRRYAEMFNVPWEKWEFAALGLTVPQAMQLRHDLNKNVGEKNTAEIQATLKRTTESRTHSNVFVERTDGRTFNLSLTPMIDEGFVATFEDITERKKVELALAESEFRLKTVLDTNVDGIALADVETKKFSFANQAFCDQLGYSPDEVTAIGVDDIHPPYALSETQRYFDSQLRGEIKVAPNQPIKRKDGSIFFADISSSPATFGGRTYMVGCFHDVTERKRAEEKVSYTARHDILTDLPNRGVFVEALQQAIATARRGGKAFAVLYLDLDHFKDVNDTLGHPIGDLLLQAVAQRLQAIIRETDIAARFGGDEFAILLTDLLEPADAAVLSDKVLKTLREPFSIEGHDIRTGASIGIEVHGPGAPDEETLLSHADVALYRAKSEERGTYRFFTDAMDTEVRARVTLVADLREAIASSQFFLMYQPQVDVDTRRIIGVEALVRWQHPIRGLVAPGEFIPAAERSGLIVAIGHWVLHEACRQMKEWLDAGIAPRLVGVNVSALQFKSPLEFEKDIAATLAETGLFSDHLELELTETVFMGASREHSDVLLRLRKAGVRIAIDDFGTGYSSLQYLSRFPVDRIKIAQDFTLGLTSTSTNATIVKAAIGLAHDLGLDVIVEGVETAEQLQLIRSFSARKVQGFYFSKPLLVGEVTALLRVGKTPPKRPATIEVAA